MHAHSVGTILFTAIGISLVAIAAHGAFRVPDDLFLDDGEVCFGKLSLITQCNLPCLGSAACQNGVRQTCTLHRLRLHLVGDTFATDTAFNHAVARLRVALMSAVHRSTIGRCSLSCRPKCDACPHGWPRDL